jgi:hypothetical protein
MSKAAVKGGPKRFRKIVNGKLICARRRAPHMAGQVREWLEKEDGCAQQGFDTLCWAEDACIAVGQLLQTHHFLMVQSMVLRRSAQSTPALVRDCLAAAGC